MLAQERGGGRLVGGGKEDEEEEEGWQLLDIAPRTLGSKDAMFFLFFVFFYKQN